MSGFFDAVSPFKSIVELIQSAKDKAQNMEGWKNKLVLEISDNLSLITNHYQSGAVNPKTIVEHLSKTEMENALTEGIKLNRIKSGKTSAKHILKNKDGTDDKISRKYIDKNLKELIKMIRSKISELKMIFLIDADPKKKYNYTLRFNYLAKIMIVTLKFIGD